MTVYNKKNLVEATVKKWKDRTGLWEYGRFSKIGVSNPKVYVKIPSADQVFRFL